MKRFQFSIILLAGLIPILGFCSKISYALSQQRYAAPAPSPHHHQSDSDHHHSGDGEVHCSGVELSVPSSPSLRSASPIAKDLATWADIPLFQAHQSEAPRLNHGPPAAFHVGVAPHIFLSVLRI